MGFLIATKAPQSIYNQVPLEIYPNPLGNTGKPTMPSCLQNTALAAKGATTITIRATGIAWPLHHGRFLEFMDPTTRKAFLAVLTADIGSAATSISVEALDEAIPANCFVDYPYRYYGTLESSLVPSQNYTGAAPLPLSGFVGRGPTDYEFGGSFQVLTNDLDAALLQARYQADNNLPAFVRDFNPSPRGGFVGQLVEGDYYLGKPEEPKTGDTRISTFELVGLTEPVRTRAKAGDALFGKILAVVTTGVQGTAITLYGHGLDGLTTIRFGTTLAKVASGGTPDGTATVTTNDGNKITATLPPSSPGPALTAGDYFVGLTDAGTTRHVTTDYSRFTVS